MRLSTAAGPTEGRAKLLPALAAVLACVFVLKASEFWLGLNSADAASDDDALAAVLEADAAYAAEEAKKAEEAAEAEEVKVAQPDDGTAAARVAQELLAAGKTPPGELLHDFDAEAGPATPEPKNAADRLLISLNKRREALETREAELETRVKLLEAAELRVDERITELKAVEARIADLLGQREVMQEERIAQLVKTYENMKPKSAAAILENLDRDILLDVMARMKPATKALVLAQMTPARARDVTEGLALNLAEENFKGAAGARSRR